MAGQTFWGNAGDSTNAQIVRPQILQRLYMQMTWRTLVGRLNANRLVRQETITFQGKDTMGDIGNSSIIQTQPIRIGNEVRLTLLEYLTGNAGSYGDAAPAIGGYNEYKHSKGWINQIDSKRMQLPGRCSLKQVKEVLNNAKSDLLMTIMRWAAEEIDYEWIRSGVFGASRNVLSTTADGALGIALPGATAGQTRSCYNFYVAGEGVVTPNYTRATHEAAVDTALGTLGNNATDHFDLGEVDALVNLCDEYELEPYTLPTKTGSMDYRGVFACDRSLLWRLAARSGTYETLMKDARERGQSNPAINHRGAIVIDGILMIPYKAISKYNPTANGGTVPTYGPGLDGDPRTHTNTSALKLGMLMGAKSFIRGQDRKFWVTVKEGDHGKGMELCLHWDDGFTRNEWFADDGRTEISNPHMFVGCWYDAGIGTAIGA